MDDEVEINHCTTCGEPIYYDKTMYQGLRRLHTSTGAFLCPEPSKPGNLGEDTK